MALRLNGSSSGYVELDAPATAASNTLTLPDGNGTSGQYLQTNGSGGLSWQTVSSLSNAEDGAGTDFEFNSGYGSNATAYGCRAWVNFNGTGTVAIREDANVTSITDNSTGNYTVNFTNAMPDSNYATQVTSADVGTGGSWTGGMKAAQVSAATGSVRISGFHGTDSGEARDTSYICVAIFR